VEGRGETTDRAMMARALELARRGRGRVSPNPLVGAVVVKGGRVAGRGFHERFGGPHAEVRALEEAGPDARGATMYVTLEPCCTWGKTPPCTEAIVAAGVARVVVPILDPNPSIDGGGLALLEDAGIVTEVGLMREEAEELNAPYLKFRRTGLPFVRLKLAVSVDGRVAAPNGPRWISCEESRALVHAMRSEADCVMVGIGTVLADDPELTDRREDAVARQPARLVLDGALRLPPTAALVEGASSIRSIAACAEGADCAREERLTGHGVTVWRCPEGDGGLDLSAVLRRAGREGLLSVLCEGGPRVATSLLRGGLVDSVAFFVAPSLFGSDGVAALGPLEGRGGALRKVRWRGVGSDVLIEAVVAPPGAGEGPCSRG
jgi:diaminohydroxyphosphoribosylaminopyrimidine deaminase/5-amino-6-(5-phosphoribosylamino)uracil reductase